MSVISTDKVVSEFSRRARYALGGKLHTIYLFGSRAGGESRVDSDYDFLLESRERISEQERDNIADITVDISGRNGVLLDVHYVLCEKLHGAKRFLTPFRAEVLAKGIRL